MAEPPRRRIRWRPWLRALHRDLGYVAVGLTFVYALSGLAVNHIADWDPNFVNFERTFEVDVPLPPDDQAAAQAVLSVARVDEPIIDIYRPTDDELEITLEHRTLYVELGSGTVMEEGQEPRFVLRAANWLHLNRGKQAWTWFADGYAIALLLLATTGVFMLPGRKGLLGRGGILVALGVAVPVVYLMWFGGAMS